MPSVLVIDDDETVRDVLKIFLQAKGFEVTATPDGQTGLDCFREGKYDAVLSDLVMPGVNGIEVLKGIVEQNTNTPVIMITAYGSVQTAVEAMKMGAFDYVTKPFVLDELHIILERAIGVSRLHRENLMLKMQLKKKYNFKGLIGDSHQMQKVYEMIEKIADTDSTVMITGESGTGKELVAKTIHFNSSRAQGPFVPLNCAAIPKDLLESELFGHEKGAFTGALSTRIGRFELAHNGTLFLDEIGELDPSLQVKLLRVLQEREFERVGGVKTIKVDVRILAATNKDLEKATKEGKFREDLFYRLNVIPLQLPPMRKRTEDIPLLMEHFVHEFSKKRKREPLKFPQEVMDCLMKYKWPGNVRELENLIERLTILSSGNVVVVSDLPEKILQFTTPEIEDSVHSPEVSEHREGYTALPAYGLDLNMHINNIEKNLILKALEKTGGVRSKAAGLLGLNRTTLIEKMKKMGIEMQRR
jgi:two-component system, NtrC family, response regulator PilR